MVLAGVANMHPFRNPAEDRAAIISSLHAIFDGSMRSVSPAACNVRKRRRKFTRYFTGFPLEKE